MLVFQPWMMDQLTMLNLTLNVAQDFHALKPRVEGESA